MELKELPAWADVTNIWFDPKNPQNPPKNASFDSVVELRIVLDDENHVFDPSLEHIGPKMNNLETVFLSFESEARTNDFRYTNPSGSGLKTCSKYLIRSKTAKKPINFEGKEDGLISESVIRYFKTILWKNEINLILYPKITFMFISRSIR